MTDPWVMYLVVRKDARLTRGRAMVLAGAAAVRCDAALAGDPRWRDAFARWRPRPRKVALRASAEELAALAGLGGVGDDVLRCLPPRRRSAAEPELAALRPFTDAPRPADEPAGDVPADALRYVVRPGVLRTDGKAMAQAGHAALRCAERHPAMVGPWLSAGAPGAVLAVESEDWASLRADPDAVVVEDAGLTQVAPGTETVLALPPHSRARIRGVVLP